MTIGKKIKFLRNERGFTQQKLADITGIARITIAQYETDKYTPSESNLSKISFALEIPMQCFSDVKTLAAFKPDFLQKLPLNKKLHVLRLSSGRTRHDIAYEMLKIENAKDGRNTIAVDPELLESILEDYIENIEDWETEKDSDITEDDLKMLSSILNIPEDILCGKQEQNIDTPLTDENSAPKKEYCDKDIAREGCKKIFDCAQLLNTVGLKKTLDYMEDLLQIAKYQK